MPRPRPRETNDEFIQRCMGDSEMLSEFPEQEQRYAVCQSKLNVYAAIKTSFDFDGVLSTAKGKELVKSTEGDIYIISARQSSGTISYLLWGGKAGLSWSRKKLRELDLLNE